MSVQHLGSMTWREVKAFVHDRVVALVPVGSLEAHGPHLPLNTDVVIAADMARRAARLLSTKGMDLLIYPPVAYSPSRLSSKFAGTVNLAAEAYGAALMSLMDEVRGAGVRTACLVTVHVDPAHLQVIRQVAGEYGGEKGLKIVFPDVTQEPWRSRMPGDFRAGGGHAGNFETSCMMALQEDKVREEIRKKLAKVEANLDQAVREGRTHFAECGGLQAYFGDPATASAAEGEKHLETLAGIVADAVVEASA